MPLAQEGAELLAKHQDEAVEFLAKHQEDGAQVSRYVQNVIARLRAADAFGINPHQVKVSAGKQEVDVFIPKDVWDNLPDWQRQRIEEQLPSIFGVPEIDFYQNISPDKVLPGWPDPRTNIPPGSIIFHPDGRIIHNLIGK